MKSITALVLVVSLLSGCAGLTVAGVASLLSASAAFVSTVDEAIPDKPDLPK